MVKSAFSKKYFLITCVLFAVSILAGYFYGGIYPSNQVVSSNLPVLDFIKNLPPFYLFVIIFLNNSIKALLAIYLGVIFGLFPLYFMSANGFLVGLFCNSIVRSEGFGYFLAGILPHGVFEIFAIVLASAYGLWLGFLYANKWFMKENIDTRLALQMCWQKYYKVVLPILFIAALIEAFITPIVLRRIG